MSGITCYFKPMLASNVQTKYFTCLYCDNIVVKNFIAKKIEKNWIKIIQNFICMRYGNFCLEFHIVITLS